MPTHTSTRVHSLHFPELHIKIQLAYVSCFKIHCQDSLKETSQPPIDSGEFPSLATINKLCIQKAASDLPVLITTEKPFYYVSDVSVYLGRQKGEGSPTEEHTSPPPPPPPPPPPLLYSGIMSLVYETT